MGNGALSRTERTVLVVDDDPGVIQILEVNLRHANFAVITGVNGAQALAKASRERPDLILLDVILPDMDGLDICRRLKESRPTSQIPVILISAKVESKDIIAGMAAGAEDYIAKPFSPSEVVALVESSLRRVEQQKSIDPLTGLPSGDQISAEINALIRQNKPLAIIYVDIDSLKAFNCAYGFTQGDRAIQLLAEILAEAVRLFGDLGDVVGHQDGDDFVILTTTQKAQTLCQRIIAAFDSRIKTLYNPVDAERGYVECEGRLGQQGEHPIMTLSIAVVTNERRRIEGYLQASEIAAELMNNIKDLPGSNYCFDRRQNNIVAQQTLYPKSQLSSNRQELRTMQGVLAWITYLVREIEEPITAIRGCLDALSIEDWVEDLDPRQLNILGSIKGSTKRLLDILRELETLERDEWNTAEITLGEIDLKRTLDGVTALVRGVAEEKEVEIDIQGAEDIHELMVDERSLAQGLVYLLKSEIEASAPGDQVLVNASEATDAFIAIEIINRNRYIPRRELVTLFRTQRERTDGKQLRNDLHLAMILVRGLGGKIKVESQEETGTVLTVLVPKRWRSSVERINRLQSEAERGGRAARAQLNDICRFVASTSEQGPLALEESVQGLDSRIRELEVLCNRSLLLADDLSSDLEREQVRILEQENERLSALEAILAIAKEVAKLGRAGHLFDLDSARRVSRYAMAVAAELKVPRDVLQALHYAALLKDLSIVSVPPEVFDQRGQLTAERWAKLKERLAGLKDTLSQVNSLALALSFVSHKYERYDGSGYPSGLKGGDIPLGAKILAVADAFDAMLSGLSPSGPLDVEAMVREIAAHSGGRFDPQVVSVFLRVWRRGRLIVA